MKPQRLFCPYCELELLPHGYGHLNEHEAWEYFNCEYDARRSNKPPILEPVINKKRLIELKKRRSDINKLIKRLEDRQAELMKEVGNG